MLSYTYVARNPSSGEKIKAEVQAENEQAAAKLIKQQGLAPIDIKLSSDGTGALVGRIFKKVRTKDKILFSRQLSTLINAGLPLVQSLRNVASQTQNKQFQQVINTVISDIEGGSALSAALARHPEVFNQIYVSLIAAGEVSGTLDAALERLANQQEKDAELISKVRGAMVYPIIVLLVMTGVVLFMIVSVLPQVKTMYDGIQGASLPIVTRVLLAISDFTIKYWWVVAIIIGLMVFATTRWARTFGGKRIIDKMKMKMPGFGSLFMKMYMARFARTGTTLVASGVPLLQMLDITSNAVNNVHIAEAISRAIEKVKGGKSLSSSLADEESFLELVPNMLQIGEQSGAIEAMLAKTADYYEKEVDNEVKTISTVIEPALMIVLGVVAVTIVVAILMPIYGLVNELDVI